MNRHHDRCDACGAQAFVKVINADDLELLFCGHHFSKNEQVLFSQGFLVDEDERDQVNVKPSISASAQ